MVAAAIGGFVFGMVFTVIVLSALGRSMRGGEGSNQKIRMGEKVVTHTRRFECSGGDSHDEARHGDDLAKQE
jgi:crotonobetainyl-CoA:carnitine CoA-transferase CaiB-like acyl-CoA transferase